MIEQKIRKKTLKQILSLKRIHFQKSVKSMWPKAMTSLFIPFLICKWNSSSKKTHTLPKKKCHIQGIGGGGGRSSQAWPKNAKVKGGGFAKPMVLPLLWPFSSKCIYASLFLSYDMLRFFITQKERKNPSNEQQPQMRRFCESESNRVLWLCLKICDI